MFTSGPMVPLGISSSRSRWLPDHVTFEEGALLEPLSVAVHACRRSGLQMGQRVLVQGAGSIGMLCMMTARTMGASEVVITDLNQDRLDLARRLGTEHAICVEGKSPAQVRQAVTEALASEPDVTLECTGVQPSIESAILSTRSGGVVVLVGLGESRKELPVVDAALREVDIRGVLRYVNCYPTSLDLVASRKIDLIWTNESSLYPGRSPGRLQAISER
ncbi:oxidoreductase, zinc-binding dehydrogenase family protein [Cooperia oncophora]